MNFSLFIARRLSLASDGRKSSPAIRVSVTAVALSMAVMLASVAIVIGFKREIRDKVIGFNSHISLYGVPSDSEGGNIITLTPSLKQILEEQSYIKDYSLEVSIPAILKTQSDFKGVYLRSVSGKGSFDFVSANVEEGSIPDYSKAENFNKIVVSRIAARQLGLRTGDKIDTYFITDQVRVRRLEVAGIFNSHFDTYDQVIMYGALSLVQSLAELSASQGTCLQIYTDDFNRVQDYSVALNNALVEGLANGMLYRYYHVENAYSQGAGYFHWLSLLDTNVAVVLTLMAIVAIATLISGMLILILDKKRFIGVVRAMGAPIGSVRRVFIYLAMKVALRGMIIGNALMLGFLYCQDRWHFLPLDPEAYYIDFVPVEINWWSVLLLNAVCLLLIYLSLIVPSRFVAGISPTETMRNE